MCGEDRRDFIQRQTTNDIRQLTPDHPLQTVLTSATARIMDVWWLIEEPDGIGVITLAGTRRENYALYAVADFLQGSGDTRKPTAAPRLK